MECQDANIRANATTHVYIKNILPIFHDFCIEFDYFAPKWKSLDVFSFLA